MTVVDDVKSRLDILEVVSRHVSLTRSGRSHKANCPFHQEKTPSFFVFPDRQSWRCYGACATGGDVFSFVMRAENLDFGQALKSLADQAGVALPTQERRAGQQAAVQANDAALVYFRELLDSAQGAEARAYTLTGGSVTSELDGLDEAGFYIRYAEAIESRWPGRWIGKMAVPALPREAAQRIHDAGIKIYHPN